MGQYLPGLHICDYVRQIVPDRSPNLDVGNALAKVPLIAKVGERDSG